MAYEFDPMSDPGLAGAPLPAGRIALRAESAREAAEEAARISVENGWLGGIVWLGDERVAIVDWRGGWRPWAPTSCA